MTNNELRSKIETIILHKNVSKNNGNFQKAHMDYYNIFFSIFESLDRKYRTLEKKPKKLNLLKMKANF